MIALGSRVRTLTTAAWLAAATIGAQAPATATSSSTEARAEPASSDEQAKAKRVTALEGRVRRLRSLRAKFQRQENSLLSELDELDHQLRLADRELELAAARLELGRAELNHLEAEETRLRRAVESDRAELRQALLTAYERRAPSWLAVLIRSDRSNQLGNNLRMIGRLSEKQSQLIAGYRRQRIELQATNAAVVGRNAELEQLRAKVQSKRAEAHTARLIKQRRLASLRPRSADVVAELRRSAQELSSLVDGLDSTRTEVVSTGFQRLRGRLPWPSQGELRKRFGLERHARLKTLIQHQGIELAAPPNSLVRAIHAGEVAYADWFKLYGFLVILDHGDGYSTVYTRLDEIVVEVGQTVVAGSAVGSTGGEGALGDGGLYFEIRHGARPLNPEHWLRRRRSR